MVSQYWKDRMARLFDVIQNKTERQIRKQMRKYYATAMRHTIDEFEAVYDKVLTTIEEGKEPTANDLLKIDRYWKMQAQMRDELQKLGDKQNALLSKKFEENYFEVYYSVLENSDVAFSTIDTAVVQQMINSVWVADGKTWSQRVWDNIELLKETLNETLADCVVTGKKPSKLKALLVERFNVSYNNADMLVRTEIAHVQQEAAKKRYADAGVQKVQWWAAEDERTCRVCGKLHEQIFIMGNAPKIPHPRCRCRLIPVIE